MLGRFDPRPRKPTRRWSILPPTPTALYTNEEKSNRGFFLERLGAVYHEESKTDQSVAAYQKMIDMGGETSKTGYEGQVETYGEAKNFDKATETAKKAVDAFPKDVDLKLLLAGALLEQGKNDDAINMTKALLDNSDKDRVIWLKLGQFYTEMRRWKDADDAYAKATPLSIEE